MDALITLCALCLSVSVIIKTASADCPVHTSYIHIGHNYALINVPKKHKLLVSYLVQNIAVLYFQITTITVHEKNKTLNDTVKTCITEVFQTN